MSHIEQKVKICTFFDLEKTINENLIEGWLVKSMISQFITSQSMDSGKVCIIFEREVFSPRHDCGPM